LKDAISVKKLGEDIGGEDFQATYFNWEVVDFSENEITLQFNFKEPESISNQAATSFDTF
jgi:hypothetical protein